MATTATLIDLARRYVVRSDETVGSTKEFPDGPAVFLQTSARSLFVRSVHDWLRVQAEPWVAAVVVVSRQDVHHAAPYVHAFLVPETGEPVDLSDPAPVAALGRRLRDGSLTPVAYAELLVECQWPVAGRRRLVPDPAAPPPDLPAGVLDRNGVRRLEMWDDAQGDRWLAFCAVREDQDTAGADVTLWSVRVPPEGPAVWVRRLL